MTHPQRPIAKSDLLDAICKNLEAARSGDDVEDELFRTVMFAVSDAIRRAKSSASR